MSTYNPGSNAPHDGTYVKVDGKGKEVNNHFQMKKGEKFPPTQKSDIKYKSIEKE